MRILFLSHYFAPEGNAPATRVHGLTRRWVRDGHDVTVVTCAPNVPSGVVYEGYRNRWRQREKTEGVDVVRVWTWMAPNAGTVRRILNYLSYMVTATLAGLRGPRPDVVIATSPQFFCGWAGVFVSRLRRRPLVLEVRDLWPESIVAVGAMRDSRIIRSLEWLERRLARQRLFGPHCPRRRPAFRALRSSAWRRISMATIADGDNSFRTKRAERTVIIRPASLGLPFAVPFRPSS